MRDAFTMMNQFKIRQDKTKIWLTGGRAGGWGIVASGTAIGRISWYFGRE
jgi:hypothetical protein